MTFFKEHEARPEGSLPSPRIPQLVEHYFASHAFVHPTGELQPCNQWIYLNDIYAPAPAAFCAARNSGSLTKELSAKGKFSL